MYAAARPDTNTVSHPHQPNPKQPNDFKQKPKQPSHLSLLSKAQTHPHQNKTAHAKIFSKKKPQPTGWG
jgi:hypothetical protein